MPSQTSSRQPCTIMPRWSCHTWRSRSGCSPISVPGFRCAHYSRFFTKSDTQTRFNMLPLVYAAPKHAYNYTIFAADLHHKVGIFCSQSRVPRSEQIAFPMLEPKNLWGLFHGHAVLQMIFEEKKGGARKHFRRQHDKKVLLAHPRLATLSSRYNLFI